MARDVPTRPETIAALADDILHNYGRGRVIIAIDGLDGAGKTVFADALAAHLGIGHRAVVRASIDDFHFPRVVRYAKGAASPEGFYRDSFDYVTFKRVLIEPFRIPGPLGSFVLKAFDLERDIPFEPEWTTAPDDAILIVDGIFLNRPELRDLWDFSIWLDVDLEITAQRMLARDGPPTNVERYTGGQELYLKEASPRTTAAAIIDNNDFDHPVRRYADSFSDGGVSASRDPQS